MPTLSPQDLVGRLEWRYAVKAFDRGRPVAPEAWAALERGLVLTPSSFGLQPWRFVVVTDAATKTRLRAASWNQAQVEDASHLVVFAIRCGLGADDVKRWVDRLAQVRGVGRERFAGMERVMSGFVGTPRPGFDVDVWSTHQLYIALGQFMTAAAVLGVDTCPLEGIDPAGYDAILGLSAQGCRTVVACAAGHRLAGDPAGTQVKARFPDAEVVVHVP